MIADILYLLIYRTPVTSHFPTARSNYKTLTFTEQCLCLMWRVCASRRKTFPAGETYYWLPYIELREVNPESKGTGIAASATLSAVNTKRPECPPAALCSSASWRSCTLAFFAFRGGITCIIVCSYSSAVRTSRLWKQPCGSKLRKRFPALHTVRFCQMYLMFNGQ